MNSRSTFAALLRLLACLNLSAALAQPSAAASADETPKGIAKSDWQGIRAAYEAGRHAFQPTEGKDGHWHARNPGQQWLATFDQRGFEARPQNGGWTWGLELQSYGFADQQQSISGTPQVKAEGQCLSYQWDATVQEWFVNDPRGLEHGFIIGRRPDQSVLAAASDLSFLLKTRGGLQPKITADAQGVTFQDASGTAVLNYTGLKVWDADGKTLPARFEPAGLSGFRLLVDESAARYPITIDPVAQHAYHKASNSGAGDSFGYSVAVSGDTADIGAVGEDSNANTVNGNGTNNSATDSGAAYTFTGLGPAAVPPTVTDVTPATGTTAGGTSVTITGTDFIGATGVTFGGTAAAGFTVDDDTTITAATPAGSAGAVSVEVITPGGTSAANTLFTYNDAPTDITLTPASIAENNSPNATVGTLAAVDANVADTHIFTLAAGDADDDNGSFTIDGTALKITPVADFETKSSYSVRVQADDGNGGIFAKALTVAITNVSELSLEQPVGVVPSSTAHVWGSLSNGEGTIPAAVQAGADAISMSGVHVMALKGGQVFAWGSNGFGQLNVPVPAQSGVSAIAAGSSFSVALKSGQVIVWGNSANGLTTVPAAAQSGVSAIAAGTSNVVAVKNGGVIVWGVSYAGLNTVPVAAQSGVVQVAAGAECVIALKSDGSVVAWGNAAYGGSVPVNAQTGVSAIGAGDWQGFAVKNGGVIAWGWGSNGVTTVPLAAQSGVIAVTGGRDHALALKADGSVVGWGNNANGQTTIPSTLTKASQLSARWTQSAALGSANVAFGNTGLGTGGTLKTFTLRNSGTAPLAITSVTITGTDASMFQLDTTGTGGSVPAGGTTTFDVRFNPTATGFRSAQVNVLSADGGGSTMSVGVTGTGINSAPTDITLTPSSIPENNAPNATVGTLAAVDADVGQTHTFTLVSGAGSADNGSFTISGSSLRITPSADYETKSSYSVRVQADDGNGGFFEKVLTVTITNVNEAPSYTLAAKPSGAVAWWRADGTADDSVGSNHGSLQGGAVFAPGRSGQAFSFNGSSAQVLVPHAPAVSFNGSFSIEGWVNVPDRNAHYMVVTKNPTAGGNNLPGNYELRIAPGSGLLDLGIETGGSNFVFRSSTLAVPTGQWAHIAVSVDTSTGISFYVNGVAAGSFTALGTIPTNSNPVRIGSRADGFFFKGLIDDLALYNRSLTLNEVQGIAGTAPAGSLAIAENAPIGTLVGTLTGVDPDSGDMLTYTLVSGMGATDNSKFTIIGNQVFSNEVFDFETQNSYSIRVRITDSGMLYSEQALTVNILDLNEAPAINNTVAKYLAAGGGVGNTNAMRLMRLNAAGTALVSSTTLPSNTTASGFTSMVSYNATSGQMILGNSYFHLPSFLNNGTFTVNANASLSNNSPWQAHLPSGNFVVVRRNGSVNPPVQTFNPAMNTITNGALYPGLIPEASWLYNGVLYVADEGLTVHSLPVAAVGSTTGNMISVTPNPILARAIPHGDAGYTETSRMVVDPSDGMALLSTGHGLIYLFDLDEAPTPGAYLSRDLRNYIMTSGGGFTAHLAFTDVRGVAVDSTTGTFYVQGGLNNSSFVHGGDFLLRVTKTGDVTVLAQELAGDIVYSNSSNNGFALALAAVAPNVFTLAENSANGTTVGTVSATDPDTGTVFSNWTITGGNTGGAFALDPTTGVLTVANSSVLDYETVTSFNLTVTVSDGTNTSVEGTVTINLTDLIENAAPTDITLTPSSIAENNAPNATVGALAAVDADAGDAHVFALVSGDGDDDNGSFTIDGTALKILSAADFETQDSYSIRVQADDGDGGILAKELTVTVTDTNDAPVLAGGPVELDPIYDFETTSVVSVLAVLADTAVTYSDDDAGALSGLAVVGASGAGLWEYSATGASWTSMGAVSDASALLLPSSYLLRHTPAYPGPDGGETASLTLRGWDQTGGTAGAAGTKVNASMQGGAAPFSTGTVALTLVVREDDRAPTVSDVEINEASAYAVFEVGGAAGQLLTLALANDANPSTADATIAAFTLETLNTQGTAWVAHTPGSLVAVPAGGTLLARAGTSSEQDEAAEGVEFFTLVAAALSGASGTGLGSIRDDDEGAVFLASNLTATPNDPDDAGYPVVDDDVVKHIQWGDAGSLAQDSLMDATLATMEAFFPLFYEGMGQGLFDVRMAASGMVGAGLKRIGGQPGWSLTASSGGSKAVVSFRFFKAGSTTELKHLKNILFRIEDAEAGEELSGFSYWDGHGNKVPVPWNNTAVFSYSHTPRFSSANTAVVNDAPLESMTQAGKWVQVDLRGLQVTGVEFSHRKSTSAAGSVVITHLAGQLPPGALDFGGTFSPLQVKANASDEGTVPDYRPQATWTGGVPATVDQSPAPGTLLPLGAHEITLTLDDGSGVVAAQGFDLLVVAPKRPLLVVSTPAAKTTELNGLSPHTVSGTVRDLEGVGVSKVEVVHNGTLYLATPGAPGGTGISAWSLDITPVAGANTLSFTAEDSNGIRSLTLERGFTFTRHYALDLTAEPAQGTITLKAGTARSTALLGASGATKNYSVLPATPLTLTARPKTGHVFSHWSGLPGLALSAGNVATLVMPSGDITEITAHFAGNPFLPPAGAGSSFLGLLRPVDAPDTANDSVAMISGTLATGGGFSGKILLAGLAHSFAATFQGDGSSTFTVAKVKVGALPLAGGHELSLAFTGGVIEATLVKAGVTSTGTLRRGIYSATAKVPQALLNKKSSASQAANNQGFFTAALPAKAQTPERDLSTYPQGDGYTTLTLRDNGTLALSGVLADGSTVTASSLLVEGDNAPVFVQIITPGAKTRNGSLSGTLTILPGAESDVTGSDLLWIRPGVTQAAGTSATAKATQIYTAGWPAGIMLDFVGALYHSSLTAQAGLSLPAPVGETGNARLDFSAGKLAPDLAVTDFYIAGNSVAKIPATNQTFTLTLSTAKATFNGTFTPNWTSAVTAKPAFKGIMLQKGADGPGGYGFFHSNRASDLDPESGRVTLSAPLP